MSVVAQHFGGQQAELDRLRRENKQLRDTVQMLLARDCQRREDMAALLDEIEDARAEADRLGDELAELEQWALAGARAVLNRLGSTREQRDEARAVIRKLGEIA